MPLFAKVSSKLLAYVVVSFVATAVGVVIITNYRIEKTIDENQTALYEERLHAVANILSYHLLQLEATNWREAYEEDFQNAALKSIRSTFYGSEIGPGHPVILDSSGAVVLHPEFAHGSKIFQDRPETKKLITSRNGSFNYVDADGHRQWVIYKYFSGWDWIIEYTVPFGLKYAEARLLRNNLVFIMTLIVCIVATFLSLIVNRMIRPVTELTQAATALAAGENDIPIRVKSTDEFGILADSFVRMRDALRHKIDELAASEDKLRRLIELSPIAMAITTPEGNITSINKKFIELFGYTSTDLPSLNEWFPKAYPDPVTRKILKQEWIKRIERYFQTGVFESLAATVHCKDDSLKDIEFHFEAVGEQYITSFVDVSERNRTRDELLKEKEFSEHVINSMPGIFFLYQRVDGHFLLKKWNENYELLLGYSREGLKDAPAESFCRPEDVHRLKGLTQQLFENGSLETEFEVLKVDGTSMPFYLQALLLKKDDETFAVGTGLDLSELKQAEEERHKLQTQLVQSQKMEAVGTMAGGIAHDFNNILSAIIGYTELSLMLTPAESQVAGYLHNLMKAGNRAKALVQQILTYSRQTEHERKPVQMKAIVEDAIRLLSATLPSSIEIKQNMESDSIIMGDSTQIHQILMNLCTNSSHAMRDTGGVMRITLTTVELGADSGVQFSGLKPGQYANLIVSDTGHGMTPEVLARIFDPFFTTKDKGEGTGMGLAVVHGIVKSYGGAIYAYSEPGKGTIFKVFLPAVAISTEPVLIDEKDQSYPKGTERILLVDDEPDIVVIGKEMLGNLGYLVETVTSSLEALDLFQQQADRFDLVITDMTMPQLQGDKLAEKLLVIRPDIPIILCTGFSHRITEEKLNLMRFKGLLMKPIARSELATVVRKVLDEAAL